MAVSAPAPTEGVLGRPASSATPAELWWILAAAAFTAFAVVTLAVARGIPIVFDGPLLAIARGWDGSPLVWEAISQAANIPLIVVGFGIVAWLAWTRRRSEAILVLLVLAAATAGSEAVKELVARPRPVDTQVLAGVVYSYPSGHILEALTIYGIIGLKAWHAAWPRWVRAATILAIVAFVALVGVARAALGAHYPSDVLGGVFGGIGVVASYAALTDSGRGVRPRQPRPPRT